MLRVVDVVGQEVAKLFPFEMFNKVQSECAAKILQTDESMVISAPTGSGKTDLMVMAMLRMFGVDRNAKVTRPTAKVVYIAPIKALASEKATQWDKLFKDMGIKVCAVTGDTVGDYEMHIQTITRSNIIVTTPEKFDSVTRRWRDEIVGSCVHKIGLLLIDEVHLLNEERGAVLEALVSRMKTIRKSSEKNVLSASLRFMAVSATMSNSSDIGKWVNASEGCVLVFGNEDRPVPLSISVKGYYCKTNPFLFERFLTYKLPAIINEFGEGKPVLIFCQTRKSASLTATHLSKESSQRNCSPAVLSVSKQLSKQLLECVQSGVAFHHAGMPPHEREIVEKLYFSREITVLCTTTTLAMGVNLPAHLVVIKGTTQYHGGKNEELTKGLVMQMAGRAGRAGMDDRGTAIIMTSYESVRRYDDLSVANVIESRLHENIIEHINAEVCLGTLSDKNIAIEWLKTTFYWIRAHDNPSHYGFKSQNPSELQLEMINVCDEMLNKLVKGCCIKLIGNKLQDTAIGRSMARYYLAFSSIETIHKLMQTDMTMEMMLQMLAKCGDFEDVRIRMGEKKILNSFLPTIRYLLKSADTGKPIKAISENWQKRYILMQLLFVREKQVEDWTLKNDQTRIQSILPRLLLHCIEYATEYSIGPVVLMGYNLLRSVERRLWGDIGDHLKQFDGVGDVSCQTLERVGIRTLDNLLAVEAPRLDSILNRSAPYGFNLKTRCAELPRYSISVTVSKEQQTTTGHLLRVHLSKSIQSKSLFPCHLVAYTDSSILVCNRKIPSSVTEYDAEIAAPMETGIVKVFVVNDRWFGIDSDYEVRIQEPKHIQKRVIPVTPPKQITSPDANEPGTIPASERGDKTNSHDPFKKFEFKPTKGNTIPVQRESKKPNSDHLNGAENHLKVLKELVTVTGHDVYSNNNQLLYGARDDLPVPLPGSVSKDLTSKPKELPLRVSSSRNTFKNLFSTSEMPQQSQSLCNQTGGGVSDAFFPPVKPTAEYFFPSSAAQNRSAPPPAAGDYNLLRGADKLISEDCYSKSKTTQQVGVAQQPEIKSASCVDQFFPQQQSQRVIQSSEDLSNGRSLQQKMGTENVGPLQQTALDNYFPTVTRTPTPVKVFPKPSPKQQSDLDRYFPLKSEMNKTLNVTAHTSGTASLAQEPAGGRNSFGIPSPTPAAVGESLIGGRNQNQNVLHPQLQSGSNYSTKKPLVESRNPVPCWQASDRKETTEHNNINIQSEKFLTRGCLTANHQTTTGLPNQSNFGVGGREPRLDSCRQQFGSEDRSSKSNRSMGSVGRGSQNQLSKASIRPQDSNTFMNYQQPITYNRTLPNDGNLLSDHQGTSGGPPHDCRLDFDINIEPEQPAVCEVVPEFNNNKRLLSSLSVEEAPTKKAATGIQILEQLKELVAMKKEGMLSDEEFTQAKGLILQEKKNVMSGQETEGTISKMPLPVKNPSIAVVKPVQSMCGTPRDFNPPARPTPHWGSRSVTDTRIQDAFQKTVSQFKKTKNNENLNLPQQQTPTTSHVANFLSQF